MQRDHLNEIDPAPPVTEQASSWWALLNSGDATPDDHFAFGEWVARSPDRVEAFLQTARLAHALKSKDLKWPETPADILIREAKNAASDVVDLPVTRRKRESQEAAAPSLRAFPRPSVTWPRMIAMTAIVLAAVIGGRYLALNPARYQTALGEQRSVVLSDGSVVTLNTSSAIEVRMAKDHRMVKLISGEALFQVAHDTARPFDVSSGNTTVRAVGTQFNVDRRDTSTTVTVVEGKVAVYTPAARGADAAKLPLTAGEQLIVAPHIAPRPVRTNLATATAWTQRKLVFEHRPLSEVATEFNRYNHQTIAIESDKLRDQEVTGVFQANDPESFITFLETIPDVTIEQPDDNSRWIVRQAIPVATSL